MRAIRPMNMLLVVLFLLLSGCQYIAEPVNSPLLKASLEALAVTTSTFKSIAYYNDKYRSVRILQSSGNPMRDALDALFTENDLENQFSAIELAEVAKSKDQTVYTFSSTPKYPRSMDGRSMPEQFNISIGRNQQGLNYSIEFLSQP